MKSIEELYKRALDLKNRGMSDKEISTELHLSVNTVTWLLSKEFLKEKAVRDVKIGWRTIGVFGERVNLISEIFSDIIEEEANNNNFTVDAILGVTINGIPFATMVSYLLGKELIIYRPHPNRKEGIFSSNFASVNGKNIVIIDDVASTGETLKRTVSDVKKQGGTPVLLLVIASKMPDDSIDGVRMRSLVRTRLVGK